MKFQYARVQIAAYAVTFVWSLVILVAGFRLDGLIAKGLSGLPLLLVLVFAAFDAYVWRLKLIQKIIQHPDLRGTWQGALVSIREGPAGRDTEYEPIPVFLVIWQTYLTISISLISAESRSRSIIAVLEQNNRDDFTVYYHYGNVPDLRFRVRSPIHAGGSRLDIAGLRPLTIGGEYWTDRNTRGSYRVQLADRKHYASWPEAVNKLGIPEA